ncbi:CBS domain-containing protein [Cohnella fermenti]|uniref:CBS domain-containing protein n=1 Tax=Cohnella fermenti TaxID=2565925 RepID=A0A4S4BI17_9BACL|nr:CBS domain-containing protein [Cohnella fermenti]THF74237.1 CBS domain-containing protein [Cohnella fermenti]
MRKVADIMSRDCRCVAPDDSLYECAILMRDYDIGFVPVLDGRKLLGVVTDRDLVIRGYAGKHSGSEKVAKTMTEKAETISPHLSVDEAAALMASRQIRRLPVVENGELVGIVSLGDLAKRDIFASEAGVALGAIAGSNEHFVPYQ